MAHTRLDLSSVFRAADSASRPPAAGISLWQSSMSAYRTSSQGRARHMPLPRRFTPPAADHGDAAARRVVPGGPDGREDPAPPPVRVRGHHAGRLPPRPRLVVCFGQPGGLTTSPSSPSPPRNVEPWPTQTVAHLPTRSLLSVPCSWVLTCLDQFRYFVDVPVS